MKIKKTENFDNESLLDDYQYYLFMEINLIDPLCSDDYEDIIFDIEFDDYGNQVSDIIEVTDSDVETLILECYTKDKSKLKKYEEEMLILVYEKIEKYINLINDRIKPYKNFLNKSKYYREKKLKRIVKD